MSLTVAISINSTLGSGGGGVEQHTLGLVHALASSDRNDINYLLIVNGEDSEWLIPHTSDNMEIVINNNNGFLSDTKQRATNLAKRIARPLLKRQDLHTKILPDPSVPEANGRFAELGADLVHFPSPPFYRTELPTIFSPHDLQHHHYPEFFSQRTIERRSVVYSAGCSEADAVAVPSDFVKQDVVDAYDVDPARVYVMPRGPPTALYDQPSDENKEQVKKKYHLPEEFALFPSQTMEHKNHIRLIKALALLRDRGTRINLVLTGHQSTYWSEIKQEIESHNIGDQIYSLGFVPGTDIVTLYRIAKFVVFPSLFEGGGFPLIEAWAESTAVACSETTALGEKAGDAALTFNPESVDEIAKAMHRLHVDDELRVELVRCGDEKKVEFSWNQTGKFFESLYAKLSKK